MDRTNSLITRFLEFARPMHLRQEPMDITLLLDRAIRELERHNPPFAVAVHRNYAPEIPPISIDSELMERVFYNLLLNAAQASAAGRRHHRENAAARQCCRDQHSRSRRRNPEGTHREYF